MCGKQRTWGKVFLEVWQLILHPSSVIIRLQIGGSPYCGHLERLHSYLIEGGRTADELQGSSCEQSHRRILELSADAHIRRLGTVKDSPKFHKLTGAIAAYGKALALLAAVQEREVFYAMLDELLALCLLREG